MLLWYDGVVLNQDEIFDMAHPQDPSRITLHDFLHCGVGHVIVRYLDPPSTYARTEPLGVPEAVSSSLIRRPARRPA